MKFTEAFEAFLVNEVNLNQTRLDRLDQSVGAIGTFLASHSTFSKGFRELVPAGSWAHRTIIRPVGVNSAFDADVLLPVILHASWQPKDYLEQLFAAFHEHGTYKSLVQCKTRCVRIDYARDVHVDVVPILEYNAQQYITNRKHPETTGKLELSNPEAFTLWLKVRQQWTHEHFIKVVRFVKYLRDFKGTFSCKSIILKTLLGSQLNAGEVLGNPMAYADVPSTLVTVMERLSAALPPTMPAVMDPAGTGDNFSERYKEGWNYDNFRTRIQDYAKRMRTAYDEQDPAASLVMWQGIFGDGFQTEHTAMILAYSAAKAWTGEQQIDGSPFYYPIYRNPQYTVQVAGYVTALAVNNELQWRSFGPYYLKNRENRVKKGFSIRFGASTNVPSPYTLFWKVRNGGLEAAQANALRGEIRQDTGNREITETTLYTGTHYVECYVVKNGVVVASGRQPVIVTESERA